VHDPIYARSFAIEGERRRPGDGIVDLPGMGNQITREVREKVAAMTGLSRGAGAVGTTHSHSAPDFMGLWGGIPGDYRTWLVDQVDGLDGRRLDSPRARHLKVATARPPPTTAAAGASPTTT
jgi:hypothetical protein